MTTDYVTSYDLAVALGLNLFITAVFLLAYSIFAVQPLNARVYYTKWFVLDDKAAQRSYEKGGTTRFKYSWHDYWHSLHWIFVALRKPERELLAHAGLDMVVYLRMLKLGFKIFAPVMLVSVAVILPVNYVSPFLDNSTYPHTNLTKCTIANIAPRSQELWLHAVMAYLFSAYTLYMMRSEYEAVAQLRLDYMADLKKSPQQFTVLVRQVPHDNTRTVPQKTAQFFSVVHRDNYLLTTPVFNANKLAKLEKQKEWLENKLTALQIRMERKPEQVLRHKTGCMGISGPAVDSIPYYEEQLKDLTKQIGEERDRVVKDKGAIMPAAFVSFHTRWGAAVAAQTQQGKDNTKWITTWAPEPDDVCWSNLPVNYLTLTTKRAAAAAILVGGIIFFVFPITFAQGLANLNSLLNLAPWLDPVVQLPFVNSFLTSFLPGLFLMLCLAVLPYVLRIISKQEGYVSKSQIERAAAGKMYYFMLFSVFLSNVIVGSAWGSIKYYIDNVTQIPSALGSSVAGQSTFFMTYTMINAWSALASEVARIISLVIFHIKNSLLVRTPQERVKAMSASGPNYISLLSQVELYFLLPFVYWVIAPLYLPFAVVYFVFAYIVYRNQFLNVYAAQYDLGGGYWPHFHNRALTSLVVAQVVLILVMGLKQVIAPTIFLIPLPVATLLYHFTFISGAFEPTFFKFALEEAMAKDTIDAVSNPGDNPRPFLARAYLHPSLRNAFQLLDEEAAESGTDPVVQTNKESSTETDTGAPLVMVKRHPRSRDGSPAPRNIATPRRQTSPARTPLPSVADNAGTPSGPRIPGLLETSTDSTAGAERLSPKGPHRT